MSRIGKKVIFIPKDVFVNLEGKEITIKGKYGILKRTISDNVNLNIENDKIILTRINDEKKSRASHGLNRALIQNMVNGVEKNFTKTLIAEGVGSLALQ